jgi:excisionase family DNA binding protein
VYRWAELGEIPHFKIGRLVRFSEEDVEAFVANGRRAKGCGLW